MSDVGYCGAVLLAGVFVVAAAAKVRTPAVTATTFGRLGVPTPGALARAVPVIELAVATVLLAAPPIGAAAALALLLVFTAVLARAVMRHVDVSCGCFGAASSAPITAVTLARNALLIVTALVVVMTAPTSPSVPSLAGVVLASTAALLGAIAVAAADMKRTVGGLWKTDVPA